MNLGIQPFTSVHSLDEEVLVKKADAALLQEYVDSFCIIDNTLRFVVQPVLEEDESSGCSERDMIQMITTSAAVLETFYGNLAMSGFGATRLPPLYETLILTYRWGNVDLVRYRLLPNEPAVDFAPLLSEMRGDAILFQTLTDNGYLPFGKAGGGNYDPICFDLHGKRNNADGRVVRLDHEAILCHGRIREVDEVATSFRMLVMETIALAKKTKSSHL